MEAKRTGLTWALIVMLFAAIPALADTNLIHLDVDATDAARGLVHARLRIPAAAGPLTLFYPKWIPGEHMPSGPLNKVTGLAFSAGGHPINWRRDDEDMFAFHLDVPAGATTVEVSLDFLPTAGGGEYSGGDSSTPHLLDLSWNQVLLYPQTGASLKIPFAATLKLPSGWHFGSALPVAATNEDQIQFANAPLETLVDSPVLAGEYLHTVALTPEEPVQHFIHLAADNAADLDLLPPDTAHFPLTIKLVHEADALFGAHHYRDYHFLLTCSDHVAHFGLEHHESSDDRVGGNWLTDADARLLSAQLLPHEMVHSWNGKFRRPAGLVTPDYQQPMRDELLWVYEGLTDYLGKVLTARSGLETNDIFCESLAIEAAMLDHRVGRQWRSLADTAVAAPLLYASPGGGVSRRRAVDFYPEGDLIWLEADTLIRQRTHGKKSLDDFCQVFYGGNNSAPEVAPYSSADVVKALNSVAPLDWNDFFQKRVYAITPHAPLGGIENAGWRLAYTNEVPPLQKIHESLDRFTDVSYSLGFTLDHDGVIGEVLPDSPADRAGVVQGMKLIAVNGRAWSAKILRAAIKNATTNTAPMALLTEHDDYYQTFAVDHHGGESYPVLERDDSKPDLLAEIIKPLTSMPRPKN